METYRHSGSVPLAGWMATSLAGFGTAIVLGAVYTYLVVYIPIVYVNFLATFVFGLAIGAVVGRTVRVGKIRNTFVAGWMGFLAALLGLYVAWAVDPVARFGLADAPLAWRPRVLLWYMQLFYQEGFWGMRDGEPVKGIFLAIVWLAEAAIIVGAATVVATKSIAHRVFCERCGQWATHEEGVRKFIAQEGQEAIAEKALAGQFEAFDELYRAPDSAAAYLRLDLDHCETCGQCDYLTLQTVVHVADKQGNLQARAEPVLTRVALTVAQAHAIREAGRELPEEPDEVGDGEEASEEETA